MPTPLPRAASDTRSAWKTTVLQICRKKRGRNTWQKMSVRREESCTCRDTRDEAEGRIERKVERSPRRDDIERRNEKK